MDSDWMETQISDTKTLLINRGFPRSVWDYYLTTPREWRKDDMDPRGVHNGVIAVLTSQNPYIQLRPANRQVIKY